ncbi:TPR-like protein [Gigaspora margarita]|uniref:TPR-like protein n=1 Tax=Gigaspora margarita TaxID=4874 RepID=A0A8H3X2G0_GIGMA|nr:TPR-like protein [Gigaspora margarita]
MNLQRVLLHFSNLKPLLNVGYFFAYNPNVKVKIHAQLSNTLQIKTRQSFKLLTSINLPQPRISILKPRMLVISHQKFSFHSISQVKSYSSLAIKEKKKETTFIYMAKQARSQIFKIVKFTLTVMLIMIFIFYIAYRGFHLYIEYFLHPTSKKLSSEARNCLRGAYFREEMVADSEIAEIYLRRALEIAINKQNLNLDDPVVIDIWLRIAYNYVWTKKFEDASLVYRSVLELLLQSKNFKKAIEVSKKLAEVYINMKEFDNAEKCLCWSIEMLQLDEQEYDNKKNWIIDDNQSGNLEIPTSIFENSKIISEELIKCVDLLAGLYAQQKKFELALPLYLGILKMLQNQQKNQDQNRLKCWEAITMGHLGEVLYGVGKHDEAMGWMQQGLTISKNNSGNRDCDECSGVIFNNLGLIYEKNENFEVAKSLYNQAILYASKAQDFVGLDQFSLNLDRLISNEQQTTDFD